LAHKAAPVLICLLLLAGCGQPPQAPQSAAAESGEPGLDFEGFRAVGSFQGVKQWEAEATRAKVFHGRNLAVAEDVSITYFQGGKPVSRAKARHADINLKNYDLAAEGEVLVRAQNGVVLATERLNWDNALQRVRTRARVKVWRGTSVLTGRGLLADRKLENVEVQEDVKIEAASVEELRKLRRD
jgi:LPS export ABC transporter protein LptC